jgi:O-antigen/teichoic acid export membrane protein
VTLEGNLQVVDSPERVRAGRLGRSAILFGLGGLAGKAAALATLPILARLLSPEEFGRLDVLNAMIGSALAILVLGTDVAATRLYFDRAGTAARRDLISSWYAMTLGIALPVGLALIAGSAAISDLLFGSPRWGDAVALTGAIAVVGIGHSVTLGVMRTTDRPLTYALIEGGALLANAILAVGLLVVWRAEASAVLLALAACWGSAALVGIWLARTAIQGRPNLTDMKDLLRLGLPLAPAAAIAFGMDFLNRAYLLGSAGALEAGFLSIAVRIASVAMLIVTAVQLAWHPHAFALNGSPESGRRLGNEAREIIVAVAACVGILGLAVPELVRLIGAGRFDGAGNSVSFALAGVLGSALFLVAALPLAMARATSRIAVASAIGVLLAGAINYLLAPTFGATGTAAAIAAGQFTGLGVVAWFGRAFDRLSMAWGRVVTLSALAGVALLVGQQFAASPVIRALAGVIFLGTLVAEGTLRRAIGDVVAQRRRST